jgi:hypothetical protein
MSKYFTLKVTKQVIEDMQSTLISPSQGGSYVKVVRGGATWFLEHDPCLGDGVVAIYYETSGCHFKQGYSTPPPDLVNLSKYLVCITNAMKLILNNRVDVSEMLSQDTAAKEESKLRKKVRLLVKENTPEQLLLFLNDHNYEGIAVSSKKKRDNAVYKILGGFYDQSTPPKTQN